MDTIVFPSSDAVKNDGVWLFQMRTCTFDRNFLVITIRVSSYFELVFLRDESSWLSETNSYRRRRSVLFNVVLQIQNPVFARSGPFSHILSHIVKLHNLQV